MMDQKPLYFSSDPKIGFTAERRADGGMNLTFADINSETLGHWQKFAEEHLIGSESLVRNLYDLSQIDHLSDRAVQMASAGHHQRRKVPGQALAVDVCQANQR